MEASKVDMWLMINGKYFESYQLAQIREKLLAMPEDKWQMLMTLDFKDPTPILLVSIIAGQLGIDRFLIGDVGLGVLKLITCGGFFVWFIVDFFLIMGATKEKNAEKLARLLV